MAGDECSVPYTGGLDVCAEAPSGLLGRSSPRRLCSLRETESSSTSAADTDTMSCRVSMSTADMARRSPLRSSPWASSERRVGDTSDGTREMGLGCAGERCGAARGVVAGEKDVCDMASNALDRASSEAFSPREGSPLGSATDPAERPATTAGEAPPASSSASNDRRNGAAGEAGRSLAADEAFAAASPVRSPSTQEACASSSRGDGSTVALTGAAPPESVPSGVTGSGLSGPAGLSSSPADARGEFSPVGVYAREPRRLPVGANVTDRCVEAAGVVVLRPVAAEPAALGGGQAGGETPLPSASALSSERSSISESCLLDAIEGRRQTAASPSSVASTEVALLGDATAVPDAGGGGGEVPSVRSLLIDCCRLASGVESSIASSYTTK